MQLFVRLLLATFLAAANAAFAQQFAGQTVTVIVNYPAGGPSDIEARIIAKYLPKYLQGVSSVIIRNVGGAGGRIGVNQLGEAAPKDRLLVGYITWNPVDQLIQEETLHVRFQDLKLITGFQQVSLLYVRRDTPPGINRPSELVKLRPFKAGALSPSSPGTVRQRLALDLLGAKYDTIAGYKGLRDVEIAVRQGDINLSNTSLPTWSTSVKPTLVDTGIVIPVLQYDYNRADAIAGRSPDLPEVPSFLELYKEIWGKEPSGEKWETLQMLTRLLDSMFRTVFMPPIAPAAAVAEMRGAFDRLGKDADFIADYEKVIKTKPHFVSGAEGERIVAELGSVPPAMSSFLRKYVAETR